MAAIWQLQRTRDRCASISSRGGESNDVWSATDSAPSAWPSSSFTSVCLRRRRLRHLRLGRERGSSFEAMGALPIWVTGLAYSPDGALLASACGTSNGYALRSTTRSTSGTPKLARSGSVCPSPADGCPRLAFDPTGRRLVRGTMAVRSSSGTWRAEDPTSRENLDASAVRSAIFVNGGRPLIVGHQGGTVALFDLEAAGLLRRTELPRAAPVSWSDGRGKLVLAGDLQGGLSALALPALTVVNQLTNAHDGEILSLGLEPRRSTAGHEWERWSSRPARRGRLSRLFTFPILDRPGKDLAFDVSGRWLAFGGADSDVALWDLTLLHEGLKAAGLAWDEPSPAVAPASDPSGPTAPAG